MRKLYLCGSSPPVLYQSPEERRNQYKTTQSRLKHLLEANINRDSQTVTSRYVELEDIVNVKSKYLIIEGSKKEIQKRIFQRNGVAGFRNTTEQSP